MKLQRRALALAFLLVGGHAYAQQTAINGTITDSSGAAIPKAHVLVRQTGGVSFTVDANERGVYQIPSLAAGEYAVTANADGFTAVEKRFNILIGQNLTVDVSLPVLGTSQNVTVSSGESIIDTTSSSVAGNVTPDEVKSLPINGRDYMALSTLVPGVKINAVTNDTPLGSINAGRFQINLDGLGATQNLGNAGAGEPRFSQDAIDQFQIVTNRFDATVGRSSGVVVNVQTKSGTNAMHGSAFGYFRNDAFNASDAIQKKVLPFQDSQYGGSIGGAIKPDHLWYFGSYEGEFQPKTATSTPAQTGVPFSHPETLKTNEVLGRADYQRGEKNDFFGRYTLFTYSDNYLGVSGTADPSRAYTEARHYYGYMGAWNHQVNANLVNQLKGSFTHFDFGDVGYLTSPELRFPLNTIGGNYSFPQKIEENVGHLRDDVFWLRGNHSVKLGSEFLQIHNYGMFQQNVHGTATCAANPTSWAAAFPNGTSDPSAWNYSVINQACAGYTTGSESYVQGFGNFNLLFNRIGIAFWAQDDWKILRRLTLNLGLRYDNDYGNFTAGNPITNGLKTPSGGSNKQIAPRVGFNYDITGSGKTVLRAGAGINYADVIGNMSTDQQAFNGQRTIQASLAGSPSQPIDLTNPFSGKSSADILANPSAYRQAVQPLEPNPRTPYALQISFGVQQRLDAKTTLSADFVYNRSYHEFIRLNSNLLQNPNNPQFNLNPSLMTAAGTATICPSNGLTKDSVQGAYNVCAQQFTNVNQFYTPNQAGTISSGLQVGLQRSLTRGFVGGVAYTLSKAKNSSESAFYYPNKPFINGIKDEWARGTDDQRHTLTVNGDYRMPFGLSLTSLFHYGSGNAFPTYLGTTQPTGYAPTYNRTFAQGAAPTRVGGACSSGSTCVVTYNAPSNNFYDTQTGYWMTRRNALRGRNIYRVDTRLQETFHLDSKYKIVLGVEAFNLFNHPNYGSYNGIVTSASYGSPVSSGSLVEYQSRSLQFLGRFEF